MQISIKPEDERFLQERARELGYASVSDYIIEFVARERRRAEEGQTDWAWEVIERMRGTAKPGLSTDEIMDITRSEV